MKNFIKVDAGGYIWEAGCSLGDNFSSDMIAIDGDIDFADDDILHQYVDGEILSTNKPKRPPFWYMSWDAGIGDWIDWRDLEQKKTGKWDEIKAARTADEFGAFAWGGYAFQCDEVSQRRIQGAVQLAAMDAAFTIDWTLADNSVANFTAAEMIQIGVSLTNHVNACHAQSRALRAQIDAATTADELDSINYVFAVQWPQSPEV